MLSALLFTSSHAHLFHFVKDEKDFVFNHLDMDLRVPSARQLIYNDARANPIGRMPDDTWILRPQELVNGFEPDEDTWHFPRVAGTFKERSQMDLFGVCNIDRNYRIPTAIPLYRRCALPKKRRNRIYWYGKTSGEMESLGN